jgi:hypothetical protein
MLIGACGSMVEALGYKLEGGRALFLVRPLDFSVYAILPSASIILFITSSITIKKKLWETKCIPGSLQYSLLVR